MLVDRIRSETGHVDTALAAMLSAGVCYHDSGLTADERVLVEEGFSSGVLHVLCCTSTLAAGVNLPATRFVMQESTFLLLG